MNTTPTAAQIKTLRLIDATHGGCCVNLHTARALERRGWVTCPKSEPNVPRITETGKALITPNG